MIRVDEAEFSTADVQGVKKRIDFLENKVAENHWLDCLVGCAVAASIQGNRPKGDRAGEPAGGGSSTVEQVIRR